MNPIEIADKIVDDALYEQIAQKADWSKRWAAAYNMASQYVQQYPTKEQVNEIINEVDKVELAALGIKNARKGLDVNGMPLLSTVPLCDFRPQIITGKCRGVQVFKRIVG